MEQMTLGIDVACRAAHQASLADRGGPVRLERPAVPHDAPLTWSGCGQSIPAGAALTVVMEPTRNAWVPLAAWFRRHGATVIMVPPGAVRGPAGLLLQARQVRPAGLPDAGPPAAAAP